MASMPMPAASLLPTSMTKNPATSAKRGLIVVAKASAENVSMELKNKEESSSSSNGRRELLFAAAAAACSVAKVAMADEPQKGTPEARKKYAPVCVTMPTARVCHK